MTNKLKTQLVRAVSRLARARVDDSWKGAGYPEDIPFIEWELDAAKRLFEAKVDACVSLVTQLANALEEARNGLLWYQDRYSATIDGSDGEVLVRIDAALRTYGGPTRYRRALDGVTAKACQLDCTMSVGVAADGGPAHLISRVMYAAPVTVLAGQMLDLSDPQNPKVISADSEAA